MSDDLADTRRDSSITPDDSNRAAESILLEAVMAAWPSVQSSVIGKKKRAKAWIEVARPVDVKGGQVVIGAATVFGRDQLDGKYKDVLLATLCEFLPGVGSVRVVVREPEVPGIAVAEGAAVVDELHAKGAAIEAKEAAAAKPWWTVPLDAPPVKVYCAHGLVFPHRDPKSQYHLTLNGNEIQIIKSGVKDDGDLYGVPYHTFPTMVNAYFVTRCKREGNRLEFGQSFGEFLHGVGLYGNLRGGGKRIVRWYDRTEGFLKAEIWILVSPTREDALEAFRTLNAKRLAGEMPDDLSVIGTIAGQFRIEKKFQLWDRYHLARSASAESDDDAAAESWIEFTDGYMSWCVENSSPVHQNMLATCVRSPLQTFIWLWQGPRSLSLHHSNQPVARPTTRQLKHQSGAGVSDGNMGAFNRNLRSSAAEVKAKAEYFAGKLGIDGYKFDYSIDEGVNDVRFRLNRSMLLIQPDHEVSEVENAAILKARKFDDTVLRRGEMRNRVPGTEMERVYWTWLAKQAKDGFKPVDVVANYLSFCQTHKTATP